MSTMTRPPHHTYEDYLSDEPDEHGIPDGLTREQYDALPVRVLDPLTAALVEARHLLHVHRPADPLVYEEDVKNALRDLVAAVEAQSEPQTPEPVTTITRLTDPNGNLLALPDTHRWATAEETEAMGASGDFTAALGIRVGGTDEDPDVDLAVAIEPEIIQVLPRDLLVGDVVVDVHADKRENEVAYVDPVSRRLPVTVVTFHDRPKPFRLGNDYTLTVRRSAR